LESGLSRSCHWGINFFFSESLKQWGKILSWTEDLKRLHSKPKISIVEVNRFIFEHPGWAASVIRNALGYEMYREFCLCCENFDRCCEKLGVIKKEEELGCVCNEFMNQEPSEANKPKLRTYFREVVTLLNV